ncbi:MAG: peptidase carboxypeptidase [Marmoricola sp.]|nr:peptidase carboxypeptidase [Marmoricola sp.]
MLTRLAAVLLLAAGTLAIPGTSSAVAPQTHIIEKRVIGHTVQGRKIVAWRIGNPSSTRKVVLIGAIHGDEFGPSRILLNLRDGPAIRGADIWVIPRLNNDGVAHHTRLNAYGVNLNRNFPVHWAPLNGASESGPRPASEPETRALMAFMREIRPTFVVSFHQPLHGVGMDRKGVPFQKRLARGLHLPRHPFNCNSACHGTFTEWFNKLFSGTAITVEYGAHLTRTQVNRTGPTGLLSSVGASR